MGKIKIVILVILGLVAIMAAGAGMGAYDRTLVSWTVPLAVGVGGAAVSLPLVNVMWRRLTCESSLWINGGAHVLFFVTLFSSSFLLLNLVTDPSTAVKEEVEVVKKFQKQHQSRGGGRHRHHVRREWTTYHVTIKLADGREKTESVNIQRYNRIRSGSRMKITLEKGLLGPMVITRF